MKYIKLQSPLKNGYCFLGYLTFFIVRAKKQLCGSSLCHSLLLNTYVELLLCYVVEVKACYRKGTLIGLPTFKRLATLSRVPAKRMATTLP